MIKMVEIEVVVKHVTELAILVDHGREEKVWIPKSSIDDFAPDADEVGLGTTSIFIPEWLATLKGMV